MRVIVCAEEVRMRVRVTVTRESAQEVIVRVIACHIEEKVVIVIVNHGVVVTREPHRNSRSAQMKN